MSIEALIGESARVAVQVAWPVLGRLVGGRLLADEAGQMLDRDAGIDLFWQRPSGARVPVAVRFQRGGDYRSFTLRSAELRRLHVSIPDADAIRPRYLIHSYVREDRLLSVGMAAVEDVVAAMDGPLSHWRVNPQDGTDFKAVFWEDMALAGFRVPRWSHDEGPVVA